MVIDSVGYNCVTLPTMLLQLFYDALSPQMGPACHLGPEAILQLRAGRQKQSSNAHYVTYGRDTPCDRLQFAGNSSLANTCKQHSGLMRNFFSFFGCKQFVEKVKEW